jgi:hypothetical protein
VARIFGFVYRSTSGSVLVVAPKRVQADRRYRRFGGEDPAGDFRFAALLHLPDDVKVRSDADLDLAGSVRASHGKTRALPVPLVGPIALEFVPAGHRARVLPRSCSPRWAGEEWGFVLYR